MTKSELKTGMVVTMRSGKKMHVYIDAVTETCGGCNIITNGDTWSDLCYYNEDLTYQGAKQQDIVKVELVATKMDLNANHGCKIGETIWVREEPKQMTVAEIEAILGYKVEIVSEVK